ARPRPKPSPSSSARQLASRTAPPRVTTSSSTMARSRRWPRRLTVSKISPPNSSRRSNALKSSRSQPDSSPHTDIRQARTSAERNLLALGMPALHVVLEGKRRNLLLKDRAGGQNLTDGIGKLQRDRLTIAVAASIVIKLRQAEDVRKHGGHM